MDSYNEPDDSQKMDHRKWHACTSASRQVSVLALHYSMKLEGILREVDGV